MFLGLTRSKLPSRDVTQEFVYISVSDSPSFNRLAGGWQSLIDFVKYQQFFFALVINWSYLFWKLLWSWPSIVAHLVILGSRVWVQLLPLALSKRKWLKIKHICIFIIVYLHWTMYCFLYVLLSSSTMVPMRGNQVPVSATKWQY